MEINYKYLLFKVIPKNTAVMLALLFYSSSFSQNTYSFTTCGATGSVGPIQSQINTAYASTNLNNSVTSVGGIQSFTVPITSSYSIVTAGAGAGSANNYGGRGKIISGVTTLVAGTVLKILVGQMGICTNTVNQSSGGGGGCFVTTNANAPIIVAAGGGGFYLPVSSPVSQSDGNIGTSGYNSLCSTGYGGANGNGGTGSTNGWGGGGGGFNTNGSAAVNCASTGGIAFVNGGLGAGTCNLAYGGFGGGGGTHGNTGGGGGGGGYSGGGGSNQNISPNCGGGGGSYFDAALTSTADVGFNMGQGYVVIIQLCSNSPSAAIDATSANNYTVCPGSSATLAATGSGTITWFPTNTSTLVLGSGTTFVSPALNPSTTPNTYTFYAQVTNTCSSAPRTPITLTVISSPTISVSGNVTTCTGYAVNLSANGAATYTWSNGATTQNISAPASAQFTVIGKAAATGCTASAVSNLTLLPAPNLVTTGPTSVCSGGAVLLSANGADTYIWSTSATTSSISLTVTSNTNYFVVGTYSVNGCTTIVQKPITAGILPVLFSTGNNTICAGQSATITAQGGAAGFFWSTGATTASVVLTPPGVLATYTCVGVSAIGCTSTLVITVYANVCTGLNSNANEPSEILVYPNPNNGEFIIETINGSNTIKEIEISDVRGKVISTFRDQSDKVNVDINHLSQGVYFVKIKDNNRNKILKVVKQN